MFVDAKKAHLNAKCDEEEWVELRQIEEMAVWDEKSSVGMGGLRKNIGGGLVRRGKAASTTFHHPETQVRVVVHGDNFTFAGTESELKTDSSGDARVV